jgi:hypothetical protein
MQAISAVIESAEADRFTVDELCSHAYPTVARIENKHRVAVRRAMQKLPKRRLDCEVRREPRRRSPYSSALVLVRIPRPISIQVRIEPEMLALIDAWARMHSPTLSRPEAVVQLLALRFEGEGRERTVAIRRLLEEALKWCS